MAFVMVSTKPGKITAVYLSFTDEQDPCLSVSPDNDLECQRNLGHGGSHMTVWGDDGPINPVRWTDIDDPFAALAGRRPGNMGGSPVP